MKIIKGNAISSFIEVNSENKLCYLLHVVNNKGVYGAGFAKALSLSFPNSKRDYIVRLDELTLNGDSLLGSIAITNCGENKEIIHLISQDNYGRNKNIIYLSYDSLRESLRKFIYRAEYAKLSKGITNVVVCMPYLIGCGLANGEIDIVANIIKTEFENLQGYEIVAYKF